MTEQKKQGHRQTLLVFNCHEAWVYQLGCLGFNLDIVTGLPGRYKSGWDERMRPVPPNSRLITLEDAVASPTQYYCIIAHNTTDLLDVKNRPEPRLLVLHTTIAGRAAEEKSAVSPEKMRDAVHRYLDLVGGHAVATSAVKAKSWQLTDDIVSFGIDVNEYPDYSGQTASGLRICNFIDSRRKILMWDFHERAFNNLPVRLVGHNPTMPDVQPAQNFDHLKKLLQTHRFYIHTAEPAYEEGFNMSTAEAMAAGMPVLGNCHPGSPVKHGVSGFLSDEPERLGKYAKMLLADRRLAVSMGSRAKKTAMREFSIENFRKAFLHSIETARKKHLSRTVDPAAAGLTSRTFQ